MEQKIMETVLTDILQQLKALQQQNEHLLHLRDGLEATDRINQSVEQKLAKLETLKFALREAEAASLKNLFKQQLDELRAAIKKNPATAFTTNHYSLFPTSFRLEHFPMVVNTVMKWVVILIAICFIIRLVALYAPS